MSALDDIQAELLERFGTLSESRRDAAFTRIFALEHGLTPPQRSELQQAVAADLQYGRPQRRHWLVWLVHAAEVGYDYSGQEYWQSFASRSPGWVDSNPNREWFRTHFQRFGREFNGVVPEGAWARQFTIICWPIFHALLPQDLQRQFVGYLDILATRYTHDLLSSPARLGAAIESVSSDATSRFRQFATNTELVGLIASALLLQGVSPGHEVIDHNSMDRIVEDLERKRQAKDLLERARQKARNTIHIHGANAGQHPLPGTGDADDARLLGRLGIEASVALRPGEEGQWSAFLRLPDMSSAATLLSADIRGALLDSPRFRIAGDRRSRPRPGGGLMHPLPDIELASWPDPNEPLVRFVAANPLAEQLLDTRLRIGDGPAWLFKVRDDGEAREVRGKAVRGDSHYLLLTRGLDLSGVDLPRLPTAFDGADLARLDPAGLSTADAELLAQKCGLSQASTLRLWPVGLSPSKWDGDGDVEWVLTQPKTVAVQADCQHGQLALRDTGPNGETLSARLSSAIPVFVDLDPLEVGEHIFDVLVSSLGTVQTGRLRVVVREPSVGGIDKALPMAVSANPRSPSLEDVWTGRFLLDIDGPARHIIKLRTSLCAQGRDEPLVDLPLPSMRLPIDSDAWQEHLARHFRDKKNVQDCYDAADSCVISIDGLELGSRVYRAEREPTPLRWAISRDRDSSCLQLRDDRGVLLPPMVALFDYSLPDKSIALDASRFLAGACVDPDGGLYVATADGASQAVVVGRAFHDLRDLQCSPTLRYYDRSAADIHSLLARLNAWGRARIPGQLSALYPLQLVISEFERKMVEVVCGLNWSRAERHFTEYQTSSSSDALADAVVNVGGDRSLASALRARGGELVKGTAEGRCALFSTVVRLALAFSAHCPSRWETPNGRSLIEFALRLASSPEVVLAWAAEDTELLLGALLDAPVFMRAARWVVLNSDIVTGPPDYGRTHKTWEW